MLYTISAPSGTGKTTIVKEVLRLNPDLKLSVSVTTRPIRNGEVNGKDYYFISEKDFLEKIEMNELVEYEKIFDSYYYGTVKEQINKHIEEGYNVIFDIDVKGAFSIKNNYSDITKIIYVQPPDKNEVIKRLRNRGTESEEQVNIRLARYEWEMSKINEFDYIVVNDNLSQAVEKVNEIIKQNKNI
jgi:guanylate kinase